MPGPDGIPRWQRIGRESVWGKRGLIKTGSLWFPLAVLIALRPAWWADGAAGIGVGCLALFAMAVCRTLACILANDLTDRATDVAARKRRWILDVPPRLGVAIVLCLCATGIAVSGVSMAWAVTSAYTVSLALGLAYSLPPLRLKERGTLGMVGYSLSGALAYVVVPWLWVGGSDGALGILGAAVFLDKWVNLHFHQVVDYEADQQAAGGTLNVRVGLTKMRETLKLAAALASVAMVACMVLLATEGRPGQCGVVLLSGVMAVAVARYVMGAREREGSTALVRELPSAYLALTYTIFWAMPPLAFAVGAWRWPVLWLPAALSGALFFLQSWYSSRYRYE